MASKRSLDKAPTPPVVSVQNFYCCRCGTAYSRQRGYFPVSHSPMYRGTGYLPMCSNCVDDLYQYYKEKLGDDRAALKRICMKLDLYWSDSIYDMVERTAGVTSRVRNYIGKTNLARYIDKGYDDTVEEEIKGAPLQLEAIKPAESDDIPDIQVPEEITAFWGPGFSAKDYLEHDERYQHWVKELPSGVTLDIGTKALLRQIVIAELEVNRSRGKGEAPDRAQKTLNDLLGSALLKPAQQKEDPDTELEKMPLGVGIQKWEYDRPLPATPINQRDQNNIIKNVTTWFLGHASKMVGLRNSYCKLYEEEMEKLRVKAPEFDDEDDDTFLADLFSNSTDEDGEE